MDTSSIEMILDTRAAADIWIELHRTIRERTAQLDNDAPAVDLLDLDERDLYQRLTRRFHDGMGL